MILIYERVRQEIEDVFEMIRERSGVMMWHRNIDFDVKQIFDKDRLRDLSIFIITE